MKYDVAVIGAGIAGASVAAELAPHASVVLIEAEDQPGYHTTGRSAAFWHETLGGPLVQPLTTASRPFLDRQGVLNPRVTLNVALDNDVHLLDALVKTFEGTSVQLTRIDHAGVKKLVPLARPVLAGGVVEEDCSDIDVARLHQLFLSNVRHAGGKLETRFRIDRLERSDDRWFVAAGRRTIEAATIINAAGAWADNVAIMAGARPLGIQPRRRTIVQVRVSGGDVPPDLPLTIDIAGRFYFRPEGQGRLWICPHDETPDEACDAAPDEMDVAIAIDRFEHVTDWKVAAVERKWAGLRNFAPDRLPVFGFDPNAPGFFWCAGQGGVGIQTAPAAGKLCAHLILGLPVDPVIAHIEAGRYSPARFTSG